MSHYLEFETAANLEADGTAELFEMVGGTKEQDRSGLMIKQGQDWGFDVTIKFKKSGFYNLDGSKIVFRILLEGMGKATVDVDIPPEEVIINNSNFTYNAATATADEYIELTKEIKVPGSTTLEGHYLVVLSITHDAGPKAWGTGKKPAMFSGFLEMKYVQFYKE
ncbi:MAG: hypothetical protein ACE5HO_05680 [bacterium]